MREPVFAIVGRPNVGKSTLFNRIAGRHISIVEDVPGVTRDRIYARADFYVPALEGNGEDEVRATIIDTGGFEPAPSSDLFAAVREQTELAIVEADVIVHVVDARQGVSPDDVEVARMLRKSGRPIVLAANKLDSPKQAGFENAFWELGVDVIVPIAAAHGIGTSSLLEATFARLSPELQAGARAAAHEDDPDAPLDEAALDAALDAAEAEVGDIDDLPREDRKRGAHAKSGDGLKRDAEAERGADAKSGAGTKRGDADDHARDDGASDGGARDAVDDDVHGDAARARIEAGTAEHADEIVAIPEVLRIAVVGRPNAGKSSFVNKLLGEDRHLVSPIPGTTVDSIDSFLDHGGRRYRLIDTAGIRRKRSIGGSVEKHAVVSALKGMDRADIVLLLLDANDGLADQDLKIASFADEKNKAVVVVVNKWDLARDRKEPLDAEVYAKQVREAMPFLAHAPIRFVSAKTGRRVFDVLDTALALAAEHFKRIPTGGVNRALKAAIDAHQPSMHGGKRCKFFFGTQVKAGPPTFVIAVNDIDGIHWSYRRYLVNHFRDAFGFGGAPIRLLFRQRKQARVTKHTKAEGAPQTSGDAKVKAAKAKRAAKAEKGARTGKDAKGKRGGRGGRR